MASHYRCYSNESQTPMEDASRRTDTDRRAHQEGTDAENITRSAVGGNHPMRDEENPSAEAESEGESNDNRPNRPHEPEPDEEETPLDTGDIPTEIDDKADETIDRGADPDPRKK